MNAPVVMLPRLSAAAVDQILQGMAEEALPASVQSLDDLPDSITFGPVGGSPVRPDVLRAFRDAIHGIARQAGYPQESTSAARAKFDAACARFLGESELLQSGEALRDDVWAFIATSLLRPISIWRYGQAPERYFGGVRNTFQRLWMRARALDRGVGHADRWGLVESLTEDAFVAILERPAIGGDRDLALAVAEGWLRASQKYGRSAMQPIMRGATIRIRIRNEIRALSELPSQPLAALVDEAFRLSAETAGVCPEPSSRKVTG